MTLTSAAASFIRRNIMAVLAVPPIVAAAFGVYAKKIRPRLQKTVADDNERSVKTEQLEES